MNCTHSFPKKSTTTQYHAPIPINPKWAIECVRACVCCQFQFHIEYVKWLYVFAIFLAAITYFISLPISIAKLLRVFATHTKITNKHLKYARCNNTKNVCRQKMPYILFVTLRKRHFIYNNSMQKWCQHYRTCKQLRYLIESIVFDFSCSRSSAFFLALVFRWVWVWCQVCDPGFFSISFKYSLNFDSIPIQSKRAVFITGRLTHVRAEHRIWQRAYFILFCLVCSGHAALAYFCLRFAMHAILLRFDCVSSFDVFCFIDYNINVEITKSTCNKRKETRRTQ